MSSDAYLDGAFRNRPLQHAGKGVSPQEASRPLRVISDGISLRCIIRGSIYQGSTSLEEIVTKEMFQLAMRWFWDRNGGQTSKHTGEIAWSIRCYATKHLTADEETLAFYASAMKRLRIPQDGLSDKNQRAMAQFDEPKTIEALVGLPMKLWAKAERSYKAASTKRRSKELQLCVQTADCHRDPNLCPHADIKSAKPAH